MQKITVVALAFGLMLASCVSTVDQINKTQGSISTINDKNEESARVYTRGVLDCLDMFAPDVKSTPVFSVTDRLATDASDVLGAPTAADKINVTKLVANDSAEDKKLDTDEDTDKKLAAQKEVYEQKLKDLQEQAKKDAAVAEAEHHKSVIGWVWKGLVGGLGLIGAIAFLIFCPQIAIPMFVSIIKVIVSIFSWIIGQVPAVIAAIQAEIAKASADLQAHVASKVTPVVTVAPVTPTSATIAATTPVVVPAVTPATAPNTTPAVAVSPTSIPNM